MQDSINVSINSLSKAIKNIEGTLMKDKLIDENCPPADALKQLENIDKKIQKQK